MSGIRRWIFSDAPYAGGAEQYLAWILKAAGPRQYGIIAVDHPGLRPWIQNREREGFQIRLLAPRGKWSAWKDFHALIRELKPDHLHVNMPGPYDGLMALSPWLACRAGCPRITVTEHLPGIGRVGKRFLLKKAALSSIDRAISVCARHRELMIREFGYSQRQVVAIPNGVPESNPMGIIAPEHRSRLPEDLAAREVGGGVRIVQVGSLDPRKGGDILLQAASKLEAEDIAFQLWYVGDGPFRMQLENLAQQLDIQRRVHFTGARNDVPAILSSMDICVLASHREGMPLSLLEACVQGLPIIATDVDGNGEVVQPGRNGRLIAPDHPLDLWLVLRELCLDGPRRIKWGRESRRRYESLFRLDRMLEATLGVLREERVR